MLRHVASKPPSAGIGLAMVVVMTFNCVCISSAWFWSEIAGTEYRVNVAPGLIIKVHHDQDKSLTHRALRHVASNSLFARFLTTSPSRPLSKHRFCAQSHPSSSPHLHTGLYRRRVKHNTEAGAERLWWEVAAERGSHYTVVSCKE